MRRPLRALAAAGAVALLVAACGGDGDDDAQDTTTTMAAETTTTAAEEATTTTTEAGPKGGGDRPEDDPDEPAEPLDDAEALASSVLITEDDLSGSWSEDDEDDDDTQITDCFTEVEVDDAVDAEVDGPALSQDGLGDDALLGVGSTGLVFADEGDAEAVLDEAGGQDFADCALEQLVGGFEDSGLTVDDADLAPADGLDAGGDQTQVLNGYFVLTDDDGQTYEGEMSVWFVRTGEVVSGASVFAVGDTDFAVVVDEVAEIVEGKHADL